MNRLWSGKCTSREEKEISAWNWKWERTWSIHRIASSLSFVGALDGRSKWTQKGRDMDRVKPIKSSYQDKQFGLHPQSNNDLKYSHDAGNREKSQIWEILVGGWIRPNDWLNVWGGKKEESWDLGVSWAIFRSCYNSFGSYKRYLEEHWRTLH